MIYGLGMQELLVILAIAMLLFGGKKLPEVGRNLGKAIRGFKQAEDETMKELKKAAEGPSTGSGQGETTDQAAEEKSKAEAVDEEGTEEVEKEETEKIKEEEEKEEEEKQQ